MGRYDFAPQRVRQHASQLLATKRISHPPPWYNTLYAHPPPQKLVRPALRRQQKPGKRTSRIFSPVKIGYEEDALRWEYFNDHPWELARPRVIVENDGRDHEKWDWSVELDIALNRPRTGAQRNGSERTGEEWQEVYSSQMGRPLNGEAVVQRQNWLSRHTNLAPAAAYDKARKELYRVRHSQEIEQRVAREEALATGAYFGASPLEVGMKLEDQMFENWKAWAIKQSGKLKQLQSSAYSGTADGEAEGEDLDEPAGEDAEEALLENGEDGAGDAAR